MKFKKGDRVRVIDNVKPFCDWDGRCHSGNPCSRIGKIGIVDSVSDTSNLNNINLDFKADSPCSFREENLELVVPLGNPIKAPKRSWLGMRVKEISNSI